MLPGGNQGRNSLSKEKFCPYNCRELLLPCVSFAVILCKKAAAGQVRAVLVPRAPAQRPPGLSQTAPSALGARKILSWTLHWSSSISVSSVLTWECCSCHIQGFLPTAWSPDLRLPCKTGHSAFPQLKPSCTVRSALPLSLFLPAEQKEASGLSPYCWGQHLHPGKNLLSHPHTPGYRTLSMEGWTCSGEWPPLSPTRQDSGTEGHIHQWGKEETFSISISSGQGLHLDQKFIFSPGHYMPAFQEDRWNKHSSGMTELYWQQEDDEMFVSTILTVMPLSLVARNIVSGKWLLIQWLSSSPLERNWVFWYHSTTQDFCLSPLINCSSSW